MSNYVNYTIQIFNSFSPQLLFNIFSMLIEKVASVCYKINVCQLYHSPYPMRQTKTLAILIDLIYSVRQRYCL